MNKIPFVDGTKTQEAYVSIDNQNYQVTPAVWQGTVPLSAQNLNQMQNNIETAINSVDDKADNIDTKYEKQTTIQRANVTLNSTIQANTNYTIPLNYKVGNNSLEVFYLGSKLEKRSRLQRNRRSGLYIKYNTIYRLCWRFRYEQCRRI